LRSADLDRAAAAGTRAIEAIGRMRSGLGSGQLRTSFVAARRDTYSLQVEILLRLGRAEEAFEVADAARAATPIALTPSTQSTSSAPSGRRPAPDEEALLRRIEALVTAADSVEAASFADGLDRGDELADLREKLATVRADYETRLITLAEEQGGPLRTEVDVGRARAALAPSEALIQYLVTRDRLLVFVVTRQSLTVAQSDVAASDLRSRTRLLRQLVAEPETPPARLDPVLDRLSAPGRGGAP
jgi:hypothetical protein